MSVLIKGMEMPENCFECPLRNTEWTVCQFNSSPLYEKGRGWRCPLEEVQESVVWLRR